MQDQRATTAANGDNKEDRNKKVIMASMQNFEKGDFDAMLKDAASNFTDYGDGSTPPVHSADSMKAFIKMLENSIQGYKGEDIKYYADGDYVFAIGNWTGTFKNDLMGIKATGKPVRFKDVDIFKLNDEGKVVEHSSIQNIATVLMASGKMQ